MQEKDNKELIELYGKFVDGSTNFIEKTDKVNKRLMHILIAVLIICNMAWATVCIVVAHNYFYADYLYPESETTIENNNTNTNTNTNGVNE